MIIGLEGIPKEAKKIIIFGCSEKQLSLCEKIKKISNVQEIGFFDNYSKLKTFHGYKVERPCKIADSNTIYVISNIVHADTMQKQLIELGVDDEKILFTANVIADRYTKLVKKRLPQNELRFVVDLAEHCNLNCQNCDHFSPLAREYFTDIEEFERDIRRLSEICSKDKGISHIDLEGGEPLLNPKVEEYVKLVHKYLPETQVSIYTNGIKLPDMSEVFWEVCHNHNVILEITKYPIAFDYDGIVRLAKEKKVDLHFFSGGEIIKTSSHKPLDLTGAQNKYESFHKCYMGNSECTMLKHGKIYPCTLVPNLSTFNEYFEQNLEVCERDYIDIYQVNSIEEILDFLTNPIPACRYCQPDAWSHGHEWRTSRKTISEWS